MNGYHFSLRGLVFSLFAFSVLTLLIPACSVLGGPEQSARKAFDQFAQAQGTPYKDVSMQTMKNDGTYATVHITAWFRQSAQSDWEEKSADLELRNVGGQWQASSTLLFNDTLDEARRKLLASLPPNLRARDTAMELALKLIASDSQLDDRQRWGLEAQFYYVQNRFDAYLKDGSDDNFQNDVYYTNRFLLPATSWNTEMIIDGLGLTRVLKAYGFFLPDGRLLDRNSFISKLTAINNRFAKTSVEKFYDGYRKFLDYIEAHPDLFPSVTRPMSFLRSLHETVSLMRAID